jgi:two-component system cell cycle response regulator
MMQSDTALSQLLQQHAKLPTLPGIALQILQAVQKDPPDLQELGGILATDPPLSAEILKAVNSPLYGLPTKVTSIFHAVNLLGLNAVKNLALSFTLVKNRPSHEGQFDYGRFWKDALATAVAARLIAHKTEPALADDAFTLGLLHDMGMLVLATQMPAQYSLVQQERALSECALQDAEHQILGFDHMTVGERLLASWGLPARFTLPVSCHHHPERLIAVTSEVTVLAHILHLATLYRSLQASDCPSTQLGLIDHYAALYGLAEGKDVDRIGSAIHEETHQVFPLFDIACEDEHSYLEIVERARAELINVSNTFIHQFLEQQRQIETLRRQATHDSMTQLMNYQFFQETLHRELARARRSETPLTLIMADIDRFKAVNDTYGHLAGDRAIRAVADCLRRELRETDHIARYGGEEFAIILFNTAPEFALSVAERIRQQISELSIAYPPGGNLQITMSFGIATRIPGEALNREGLLDQADKALYEAKSRGRNCCRVYRTKLKCTAAGQQTAAT